LGPGVDREQYMLELQKSRADSRVVIPWEEKASVEEMQQSPPNILITNMKQLELILTRGEDVAIFNDNSLSFIVVDEAHTFTGLKGSEVALLIRRLREFAGKKSRDIIHIGTSATIVDPEGNSEEAARKFCSRFFGVNPESVLLISEEYEAREPVEIKYRTVPLKDASDRFGPIVSALGRNNKEVVIQELEEILQTKLERADDPSLIYDTLRAVDIVQVLDKVLEEPLHLEDLAKLTWKELKREEPSGEHLEAAKAEILLWLAIGAATEYNGVRLFRPKLHYFVRGPEGAVIYFHRVNGDWSPMLVESRQQAMRRIQESEKEAASHIETRILDVVYCKNCGQHYYRKKVTDLEISREMLRGGAQGISNKDQYWVEDSDGTDIVFTDLLVGVEAQDVKHCDSENLKICAKCGLVQRTSGEICQRPSCRSKDSLLKVWAIVYGSNNGYAPYSYCPACGSYSHREKRTLVEARAVQVADVHILAQEMIQAMPESHRKLLVFADSRQDAAFQAAWMHDHARRYRIRQLFFNALEEGLELTTGDLVEAAIKILKENRELQRIICPDLIEKHEGNLEGREFERDRKKYFHIQLLREICEGSGRMDTLENWGVLCVTYDGIGPESSFVKEIASRFKLDVEMVSDFTNCFLDRWRTSGFVHSPATLLYSTQWDYHNKEEVRDGWIKPSDLYPRAIVLERDDEKNQRIKGVISSRGQTWSMQFAKKVFPDLKDIHSFLHCLWEFLVEQKYLVQVQRSSGGRRNHGLMISGYQVNEEKIRVSRQWEFFVCERCGTVTSKKTPNMKCVAWNCNGKMVRREPTEEIYDVSVLLNRNFTIMVPREHSAQVPHKIRQDIERKFKEGEGVNCIVATPTLELGIDIGDLDGVLLRNVPPDPSNYWQRAGRAGRRQRMAVIYTYCRNMHHDLAYFENPMKMLGGKISPPRINLRNRHMVERHVNATIISAILRIARTPNVTISGERITLTDEERAEVNENFEREIPRHICGIIKDFEKNEYKKDPPKLDYIRDFVCNRFDKIMKKAVISAFEDGYWPEEDRSAIENLEDHIKRFPTNLEEEFSAIFKNFEDAKNLRKKLLELKGEGRLVDEEEKQLLEHIDKYIEQIESRRDLETYTLNVLAARGFLPGYGFDEAGISAGFQSTRSQIPSFSLSRLKSKAIKEFVPGNMLYANGAKFKVIRYS
ncbi:MAG: helicase-related protein, partial [Methanomassiliicoccales archaeon]